MNNMIGRIQNYFFSHIFTHRTRQTDKQINNITKLTQWNGSMTKYTNI